MIAIAAFLSFVPFASYAAPAPLARKLTEFHFVDALERRTRGALFLVPAPAAAASDVILDAWVQAAGRTTLRFDMRAMILKASRTSRDPVGQAVQDLAETIATNLRDHPSGLTIGLVVSKTSLKHDNTVLLRALHEWIGERFLKVGTRLFSIDKVSFFIFTDDLADEADLPQAFLRRMTFRARVTDCQTDLAGLTKEALQLPGLSFTQGHASRQPKPH